MTHEQTFVLDLYECDLPARSAPEGIRLTSLAEFPDDQDTRRRLYTLVRQGVLDTPGHEGDFEPFEVFDQHIFGPSYWTEADSQLIALDGEQWVGLSSLRRGSVPQQSSFGLTVVQPSHRGRGIALALKQQAILLARQRGDRTILTNVHPDNIAMRAVNARLGFRSRSV